MNAVIKPSCLLVSSQPATSGFQVSPVRIAYMTHSDRFAPKSVDFWFDPSCPWCWMTSRWLQEVSEVRGFVVNWRPFSLKVLNEGRDMSERHTNSHAVGLQALRVIVAASQKYGPEVIGKLYTEFGTKLHNEGRTDIAEIIVEALEAHSLDVSLADAADPDTAYSPGYEGFDAILRTSTEEALELVGKDVGIPIIAIDGVGMFGPVVTPAPTGQQALDLFDGLVLSMRVEGFYELKRTRTARPQF